MRRGDLAKARPSGLGLGFRVLGFRDIQQKTGRPREASNVHTVLGRLSMLQSFFYWLTNGGRATCNVDRP